MHRTWPVALSAALLGFGGMPAFAQNSDGLYFGGSFGGFNSEIDQFDDVDIDFDEDDDAVKAFVGWRFNPIFALELDYRDLGTPAATLDVLDLEVEATAITPHVMLTLPLGGLELFARAGMMFYDVEVNTDDDDLNIDDSGEDVVYGAGLGFTILERVNLRAEYEVIEIDELDDANALWVSASWRF